MPGNDIVVFAIDGLRAAALGAYGNTWYPTPTLDQLAADAFLAEWCFAPSTDLASIYRGLWFAAHPLRPNSASGGSPSLAAWLADKGFETRLITNEPALLELAGFADFDDCQLVTHEVAAPADDVDATCLAALLAVAMEQLADAPDLQRGQPPRLTWIHSRGMYGPWDAPPEWRAALVEEGDPSPLDGIETPAVQLPDQADPDFVFPYTCGYAAQVQVLDAGLSALLAALDSAAESSGPLVVLLGVRGFPLGEHGRIGGVDERLFAEQLHVPLLVRLPGGVGKLVRSQELVELADLWPTIAASADADVTCHGDGRDLRALANVGEISWRDRLVAAAPGERRTIRTANWCWHCCQTPGAEPHASSLFVRPDDRWEANDIANLRPQIVADLAAALADFERAIQSDAPLELPALSALLAERPD